MDDCVFPDQCCRWCLSAQCEGSQQRPELVVKARGPSVRQMNIESSQKWLTSQYRRLLQLRAAAELGTNIQTSPCWKGLLELYMSQVHHQDQPRLTVSSTTAYRICISEIESGVGSTSHTCLCRTALQKRATASPLEVAPM